jgi:EmrB/QacA subfamily drug resistance transporter
VAVATGDLGLRRAHNLTLVATILGSAMTFVDGTVVNIALPTLGRDLHAGLAELQWVVLGYSLAVAALYLPAGAIGDRFGRRSMFSVGVAGFAVASMAAGLSPNLGVLLASRVGQGIAGALLTTNSLALLRATFGADSGRAVGLWTAWTGIGAMLGPAIGGALVEYASWRWVFFINLPGALIALAAARAGRCHEQDTRATRPVDTPGAILTALTLIALTYALVELGRQDASLATVALGLGAAAVLAIVLVLVERRRPYPLVPPDLLRERVFVVANLETFLVYAGLGGGTFVLALYLQSGAVGFTPFAASLTFIPISLIMFFLAGYFGRRADRDGPRRYLTAGPALMAAGMLLWWLIDSKSYAQVLPGLIVFSLGLAITVAPITSTALKAAPDTLAGIAAGFNTTTSRVGGLIAIPLAGATAQAVFANRVENPGGNPFKQQLAAVAHNASTDAFRAAIVLMAALCLAGAAAAFVGLRGGVRD